MDGAENNSANADPQRVDVQDPLPEINWFWRRTYTFILSLVSLAFIWFGAESMFQLNEPAKLFQITRYMIGILFFLILCYMVAPSAEQIVKLVQAAKILQSGIPITRQASSQSPDGSYVEVKTTAGRPEQTEVDEEDFAPRSRT